MKAHLAWAHEELEEAKRHDGLYKSKGQTFLLSPYDWDKFDTIKNVSHGYVYSIQLLGDIKTKHILDLGCGAGWLSVILAKRGGQVHAVDISAEAINAALQMAKVNEVHEKIEFKVCSAYNLDYPNSYFDLVIGQAILHHVGDKARLAKEIRRVLKPGGKAVFYECFGNSRTLERLRLLVPVRLDEEDDTHWNQQIKYGDLDAFKGCFEVGWREFQLLSRLDRIVSHQRVVRILGGVDVFLLRHFPFLRRFARTIVIELSNRVES